jgi:glycosyltransferase involved in cell wall biosynthesis
MSQASDGEWEITAAGPAYFHGGQDLGPLWLESDAAEPCPVVRLPAYFTRHVHFFLYGRALRRLLAAGWDLVHCWEEPYILAGGQVAWWTPRGIPLVYRTAQSNPKVYPPPFGAVERYAMSRAAGWICSGETVAAALGDRPGYADRPSRLIPLGVDLDAFHPDPAAGSAVLRSLGWLPEGPPVVGFLGRFVPEKGVSFLASVLDRLPTAWRALFIGAGRLEPEVRKWAARHGDRVRVCTDVRHARVPSYLNAVDLLCAPSLTTPGWREQFGRMVIEAFASGVAVVSSDSGELPRVVEGAGRVVREGDAAAWTAALSELLETPDRRREMADRGLEAARRRFAWPVVARQYLDFFDELAAQPATAS